MTEQDPHTPWLEVKTGADRIIVRAGGEWLIDHASLLDPQCKAAAEFRGKTVDIDLSAITKMDTLGAWLVHRTRKQLEACRSTVHLSGLQVEFNALLERVSKDARPEKMSLPEVSSVIRILEDTGKGTLHILTNLGTFLSFVGLVVSRLAGSIRQPSRLRLAPTVHQIEVVGLKALPVIGLMSFLIGAVIVNQSAVQLRKFGAEVFVVDMLAISVLRELGILLAAILVAGRSGSAFTAEIGSMVLHEEVDAMKTIGMHPIDVLVLPRLVALVLVMPLIAFASDILGVLGGGLIAWATLDISPGLFLDQFQAAIVTSTFLVGIIKAPFFGAVVALSGCYEGLSVKRSAESVGRHTTLAVVQAIFFVIVLDALFSMFFTTMDW